MAGSCSSEVGSGPALRICLRAPHPRTLAVYAWYRASDVHEVADAYSAAKRYYVQTKHALLERAPRGPGEVLPFLRGTAEAYAAALPGAPASVDSTFNALDELHKTHGPEMDRILEEGYDEVRQIMRDSEENTDAQTGMKLMVVLTRRMGELADVGKQAGQDVFELLGKKYPQVAEQLGGMHDELKRMAEKRGPEAKGILDETTQQVRPIHGGGRVLGFTGVRRSRISSQRASVRIA